MVIIFWICECQFKNESQNNNKQEVCDDLGVCVLNLQIVWEKSKSLDSLIKGSYDFIEGSSSLYVTNLPGLVGIGIVVVEIKCF